MPTLHVRNVPERLYGRIQSLASARNRSLSAQVVTLLDLALEIEGSRAAHAEALAGIRRRRHTYRPAAGSGRSSRKGKAVPDSVSLLREDRAR